MSLIWLERFQCNQRSLLAELAAGVVAEFGENPMMNTKPSSSVVPLEGCPGSSRPNLGPKEGVEKKARKS